MLKRGVETTETSDEIEEKRRKRAKKKTLIQNLQNHCEFLTPSCKEYERVVKESYSNFVVQPKENIPSDFHKRIQWAFETLCNHGYFYQDRVKIYNKTILTQVSRTLIGEPGLTYKYLNLRLFTLPWSFAGRRPGNDIEKACGVFKELNSYFCERSKHLVVQKLREHDEKSAKSSVGSKRETEDVTETENVDIPDPLEHSSGKSDAGDVIERNSSFNLTLLNYMDPRRVHLKPEPYFGMGRLAVSWHSDEGLVQGSTVAVYNHTCRNSESEEDEEWKIGLKVAWNTDITAVATPLSDGECYYMLDTMNDTHQHCVIAGSAPRYSATYRMTKCDMLSDIQHRCHKALENRNEDSNGRVSLQSIECETIRFTEEVHNEVEFEWLRQFWMQGAQHAKEREYWIDPMQELENHWHQMEVMTKLAIDVAVEEKNKSLAQTLLLAITTRQSSRNHWMNRFSDRDLFQIPPEHTPDYRPYWTDADETYPLPFDLSDVMTKLINIETDSTS